MKPELGLVEWNGSRKNNLVAVDFSNPTIIEDPLDPDPERRFKIFEHGMETDNRPSEEEKGHYVRFSPDGLHLSERIRVLSGCGDRHTFMYDPNLERPWVCFTRPSGYLQEYHVRMIARTDSKDLLHWSAPKPVLVPDLDDPVDCQHYSLYAFSYEGIYLGFLQRMYAIEDVLDNELVFSRDSKTWCRGNQRPAFLSGRMRGMEDCRQVTMSHNPPLEMYGTLYLYYDARYGAHYCITPGLKSHIGLASMYQDRFVSLFAGSIEGTLVTKPFTCPGGRLMANVDTCATTGQDYGAGRGAGYALCEILDKDGSPIPGYTQNDCERFWEDARRGHAYHWARVETLDALKGRTIKLRFFMVESDLYSFWFDTAGS